MRKKNAVCDFDSDRRRFILKCFRSAIAAQSVTDRNKAFHIASSAPAPRFWVSEARAAAVIGKMLAGDDPTPSMNPEKGEMYREIFARFLEAREYRPDDSIADILFDVVNTEAPRSYLSWQRTRSLVYEELRRAKRERKEGRR